MTTLIFSKKSARKWLGAIAILFVVPMCGAAFFMQSLGMKLHFMGNQGSLLNQITASIVHVGSTSAGQMEIVIHDDAPADALSDEYYLTVNEVRYVCDLYVVELGELTCSGPAFNTSSPADVGLYTPADELVYSTTLLMSGPLAIEMPNMSHNGNDGTNAGGGTTNPTSGQSDVLEWLGLEVSSDTNSNNSTVSIDANTNDVEGITVNGNVTSDGNVEIGASADTNTNAGTNSEISVNPDSNSSCAGNLICLDNDLDAVP